MSRSLQFARSWLRSGSLAAVILVSFVNSIRAAPPDPPVLGSDERATLSRYARDTWRSFEAMALPGGLSADGLRHSGDGVWKRTEKTSPTDIAAYLWSTLAAETLRIIGPDEARRRLDRTLAAWHVWSGSMASSSIGSIPPPEPPEALDGSRKTAARWCRRWTTPGSPPP